jgi:hypothetical protein
MGTRKKPPQLRGKIWVDIGRESALTEAGADLLEQIKICGSLSEAARRLGFAYRRGTCDNASPFLLVKNANLYRVLYNIYCTAGHHRGTGDIIRRRYF